ncbi:MAG: hypothetical protein WC454_07870 [Phycisphaerae bacterium]|jgi:hypothetical protein
MVMHLLSLIIRTFNTRIAGSYELTDDTLYHAEKPICSLNGLKAVRVASNKVILEFEDAEPVELTDEGMVVARPIGVMKPEAFEQLQENTADIYLAKCRNDTEEVDRLRKWRLEFCDNPDNYAREGR